MIEWNFKEYPEDDEKSDPKIYSRFQDDVVDTLVREVIQNSIDAKRNDQTKVKVQFTIDKADPAFGSDFIGGNLPKHLSMHNALIEEKEDFEELRDTGGTPKWKGDLDFLMIEDFGTTGLAGDHEQMGKIDWDWGDPNNPKMQPASRENRFRMFHWDWGGNQAAADSGTGGSWGFGKAALTKASRIRSIITLTTKNRDYSDDKTVEQTLFGHCLVSIHYQHGKAYKYFGHMRDSSAGPNKTWPLTNINSAHVPTIEDFKKLVGSNRDTNPSERGLSVVIPFPDESITFQRLIQSVLINYSVAFQMGVLEVSIHDKTTGDKLEIGKSSIEAAIKSMTGSQEEQNELLLLNSLASRPVPTVEASYGRNSFDTKILVDNFSDKEKEEWYDYLTTAPLGEQKSLRINLPFTSNKKTENHDGYFFVHFEKVDEGAKTFLHRHIIRTTKGEKRQITSPNLGALIFVERENSSGAKNPLHQFLRLCEGPAHTIWEPRGSSRAKLYFSPTNIVNAVSSFVKKFVAEIIKSTSGEKIGADWLKYNFPGNRKKPAVDKKERGEIEPKTPMPLTSRRGSASGEITFVENENLKIPLKKGDRIEITIAYKTRKGSSWSKWSEDEFVLSQLRSVLKGVKHLPNNPDKSPPTPWDGLKGNQIVVEITDPSKLEIVFQGFNPNYMRESKNRLMEI